MAKKSNIKLKPGANIGEPAAEDDHRFLSTCFVNHPAVETIKDQSSHRCLLLGRTGTGKSALLWHLEQTLPDVSRVNPKDVAFEYIGNSPILRTLSEIGVDLHILYEYLWTHVLTLHIIRECMHVQSDDALGRVIGFIKSRVLRDDKRKIALNYLEKYGDNFWNTIEQVSSEFTDNVSEQMATDAGLDVKALKAKFTEGNAFKEEEKRLFKYRAQECVNRIQMRELKTVVEALADNINKANSYYVLIDDLDQQWAGDSSTQYALIRALIDTLKTFRRMTNLKIVVAMREDLYEATLRTTTDMHFQAEKRIGIIQRLTWSDGALASLIDRRIAELFRHQYTKKTIGIGDVLPPLVQQQTAIAFVLARTLKRPRDAIAFINRILSTNEGEPLPLPARAITKAEPLYSAERQQALEYEWRSCHPLIHSFLSSACDLPATFTVENFDEDRLLQLALDVSDLSRQPVDDIERIAKTVYERNKEERFRRLGAALLAQLYKCGAVGIKSKPGQPFTYCYDERATIADTEIKGDARFQVHPMLVPALRGHMNRAAA